uniref:Uncharacterized protein LOC113788356 n=1 Tax=Dermatophagoides pteronyssinus TaxID=6956 RepID=A0A6P6XP17_DERPT|nr:uncharacterized protein LOC113788356 [Dermatophagoides pteronyssinus]
MHEVIELLNQTSLHSNSCQSKKLMDDSNGVIRFNLCFDLMNAILDSNEGYICSYLDDLAKNVNISVLSDYLASIKTCLFPNLLAIEHFKVLVIALHILLFFDLDRALQLNPYNIYLKHIYNKNVVHEEIDYSQSLDVILKKNCWQNLELDPRIFAVNNYINIDLQVLLIYTYSSGRLNMLMLQVIRSLVKFCSSTDEVHKQYFEQVQKICSESSSNKNLSERKLKNFPVYNQIINLKRAYSYAVERVIDESKFEWYRSMLIESEPNTIVDTLEDLRKDLWFNEVLPFANDSKEKVVSLLTPMLGHPSVQVREYAVNIFTYLNNRHNWEYQAPLFVTATPLVDEQSCVKQSSYSLASIDENADEVLFDENDKIKLIYNKLKQEYNGVLPIQGRTIVLAPKVKHKIYAEVNVDYYNATYLANGEIAKRGNFRELSNSVCKIKSSGIDGLFFDSCMERNTGLPTENDSFERESASPYVIICRKTPASILGGSKEFEELSLEAKKNDLKLFIEAPIRISSTHSHRIYSSSILKTVDSHGLTKIVTGTPGKYIKHHETAMLNFRDSQVWRQYIDDIIHWIDKFDIDGVRIENAIHFPVYFPMNLHELKRREPDYQMSYSDEEIFKGSVIKKVVQEDDIIRGIYDTKYFHKFYAHPIYVYLTKELWSVKNDLYIFADCGILNNDDYDKVSCLARSGLIPFSMNTATILPKKINNDYDNVSLAEKAIEKNNIDVLICDKLKLSRLNQLIATPLLLMLQPYESKVFGLKFLQSSPFSEACELALYLSDIQHIKELSWRCQYDNASTNNASVSTDSMQLLSTPVPQHYIENTLLTYINELENKQAIGDLIFLTTEYGRYCTVGGLGVMLDDLCTTLTNIHGFNLKVLLPYYTVNTKNERNYLDQYEMTYLKDVSVVLNGKTYFFKLYESLCNGVTVLLVYNEEIFPCVYPSNSDTEQVLFLSAIGKVFLQVLIDIDCIPRIIICNDWPTGLVPAYGKFDFFGPTFKNTKFCHICHNLDKNYEGRIYVSNNFAYEEIHGLPRDIVMDPYWDDSIINPSRAALLCTDNWCTVSPGYRDELLGLVPNVEPSPLAPLLKLFKTPFATCNGIPIEARKNQLKSLSMTREETKRFLQMKYFNMTDPNLKIPIFSFIGRITEQKGVLMILECTEKMINRYNNQIQIIIGGKVNWNDPYSVACANLMLYLREKYPSSFYAEPEHFFTDGKAVNLGSDFALMPSLFEPGGIVQHEFFIAGTPVICYNTGGLSCTVSEFCEQDLSGNGLVFKNYTNSEFMAAWQRALNIYENVYFMEAIRKNAENSVISCESCAYEWAKEFHRICDMLFVAPNEKRKLEDELSEINLTDKIKEINENIVPNYLTEFAAGDEYGKY